jgi:mono/diheme cytochrome c family protein
MLLVFCAILTAIGSASAADPTLVLMLDGQSRSLPARELLARADAMTADIAHDVSYRHAMSYRAVPLASLLAGAHLGPEAFLEIKALDGFVSELPAALALNRDPAKGIAMLAVEDPDKPWPALPGKKVTAGPFYLVWTGPGASAILSEQWPYQIASIAEAESPLKRWPQLGVASTLAQDDPRRAGEALYMVQCLVCHKLAGAGTSEVGPDLNRPMSPTEYFTPAAFARYLRDPGSVRDWPGRKMMGFGPHTLTDVDINHIIAYLKYKADTRP